MSKERDYSETLFLPQTDFPMRAGLPQKEPEILKRWQDAGMYGQLRAASKGRDKFILHDGPPYANGNIHIGTALNKILKDLVTRSQQMLGFDSNYVPGWDCHGLPIEWKIEEENYRSKNKQKPNFSDPAAMIAFRQECRAYAEHWLNVQREEFKRLGVEGDWDHPYTTMSFPAEAQIARELMKFAANGTLYRGSKPVMWSVVEKTALAEAEVEYEDYTSDTVWVKFPVANGKGDYAGASVVIWTTTPWTLPGNRAVSFSPKIPYGLYKVTDAPPDNWAKSGDFLILSENLAGEVFKQARVEAYDKVADVPADVLAGLTLRHPLVGKSYDFAVPMLAGEHVTDDTGTGFVHTAPGHGREDFDVWMENKADLEARGINTSIPYTVDENGAFTEAAPGFTGKRVINDKGEKGDANKAVIEALVEAGMLIARGRLEAPVSAFLALEEADHLPQHAAVVHRHGQGYRPQGRYPARARLAGDQGHPMGAGRGPEPHQRHDRGPARLGDFAPARLGRADRGVHQGKAGRLGRCPAGPRGGGAHRRGLRKGRRRRLVRAGRGRALPGQARRAKAGRRSTTFSTSGSTPAPPTPSCWRIRSISRSSPASSASATAAATP